MATLRDPQGLAPATLPSNERNALVAPVIAKPPVVKVPRRRKRRRPRRGLAGEVCQQRQQEGLGLSRPRTGSDHEALARQGLGQHLELVPVEREFAHKPAGR